MGQRVTSMGRKNRRDLSVYYVTGRQLVPAGKDFFESLDEACQGGVTAVQLREKDAGTRDVLNMARKCKTICDKHGVTFLVNDRLDIALALKCGLHVGQDDFPAREARELLGPDAVIGVSANSISELDEVLSEDVADYVGVGPVYNTGTKRDLSPLLGPRGARDILTRLADSEVQAVAIGGLTPASIPNLLRQAPGVYNETQHRSFDGLAIVSAIAASTEPQRAAQELAGIFKNGPTYALPAAISGAKDDILRASAELLAKLRGDAKPLVHHISNLVVLNDTANVTLALGGSPIMSSAAEESDDLGAYISALVLNMGTPSQAQIDAFHAAGSAANRRGKPIVFDPVGVGATPFRMRTASALLNAVHVSVVKGNASEIGALSGLSEVQSRGVDSVGDGFKQPAEVVRSLARREKVTVAMSGVIDHVTDGQTVVRIH